RRAPVRLGTYGTLTSTATAPWTAGTTGSSTAASAGIDLVWSVGKGPCERKDAAGEVLTARQAPPRPCLLPACRPPSNLGIHVRSHAYPDGHRARRPPRRRAALAAGLRRVAQAGSGQDGPGKPRPHARGDGTGPRGLPPAGGQRPGAALEK